MGSDLKVTLSLVDDFTKRLTGIDTELGGFGRNVDGIMSKMKMFGGAIAGALAVDKIRSAAEAALEFGDHIDDSARKLGLSTEKYQELGYVFKQSGTDIDGMGRAFGNLAKQAAASESILGVSTRDTNGNLKDMGSLFNEILLVIAEIPNPTERAAASQKVFGKAAESVFSIASQGKDKILELTNQTKEYGLILSDSAIKQLDEAKKSQERLDISMKVFSANMVQTFAPAIETAANALSKFLGQFNKTDIDKLEIEKSKIQSMIEKIETKEFSHGHTSYVDQLLYGTRESFESEKNTLVEKLKKVNDLIYAEKAKVKTTANAPSEFGDLLGGKTKSGKSEALEDFELDQKIELQHNKWVQDTRTKMDEWRTKSAENVTKVEEKEQEDRVNNWRIHNKRMDEITDAKIAKEKQEAIDNKARLDFEIQQEKTYQDAKFEAMQAMTYATTGMLTEIAQAAKVHGNEMKAIRIADVWIDFLAASGSAARSIWSSEEPWYTKLIESVGVSATLTAQAVSTTSQIASQQFARGTDSAPGGFAMAGEFGPEKVFIPKGSQVLNSSQTRETNTGHTFHITLQATSSVAQSLFQEVRQGDRGVQMLLTTLMDKMK